jgi:hypothetical protein
MIDPAQAVAQTVKAEGWDEPFSRLPTDHMAVVTTALPLFGIALFIAFFLMHCLR